MLRSLIQRSKDLGRRFARSSVEGSLGFLKTHPLKTTAFLAVVFYPITDRYLRAKAIQELIDPVISKMEMGSRPVVSLSSIYPRPELNDVLKKLYLDRYSDNLHKDLVCFGVVVGPSGTGKTVAVKNLCQQFPEGVLYHEISQPECFVQALAEEIGMKTKPTNIFDMLLEYMSKKYVHYHRLPDCPIEGTGIVINTLQEAAEGYKAKHGRVPVLFLDGVDLLAKFNDTLFSRLLVHAKILANENKLSIVFVSSEGSVMPLLEDCSRANRSLKVVEVLDISDKDARKFLMDKGVEEAVAEKIVGLVGGRFVHLRRSMILLEFYKTLDINNSIQNIEKDLFGLIIEKQKVAINLCKPHSEKLLQLISKQPSVSPGEFIEKISCVQEKDDAKFEEINYAQDKAKKCINEMVSANIFRYNAEGVLVWHGKSPERAFFRD